MIVSFEKKNLMNTIFISYLACLILSGLAVFIVDLAINKIFTWSLIVSSACLFAGVFIAVLKYSKSYHLLKASLLSLITLFLLFLSIKNYVVNLDFMLFLKVSGLCLLLYFCLILLVEMSKLTFWQIMIFACFTNIIINVSVNLLLDLKVVKLDFFINTSVNMILIIIFTLVDVFKIDKGSMALLLNRYRNYTQNKK